MQLTTYVLLILLFILLLLLLLLLLSLLEKFQGSRSQTSFPSSGPPYTDEEQADQESELALKLTGTRDVQEAKKSMVREVLDSKDEFLLKQLTGLAGMDHKQLQDKSSEKELVERLSRNIDLIDLATLKLAASTQYDVKVTAKTTEAIDRVGYPTDKIEMEPIRDLDQLTQAPPEAWADPTFAYQVATGELPILQSYEAHTKQAVYHMIHDVSGSMGQDGGSGIPKYIMARAIACRLISKAIGNGATFIHRFFDGDIHPKMMATTQQEAQRVYDLVAQSGYSGGGTDILNAIKAAARDIRNEGLLVDAEILLLSDGEDSSVSSISEIKNILGDIKLHVILLGNDNSTLKSVATTYKRY